MAKQGKGKANPPGFLTAPLTRRTYGRELRAATRGQFSDARRQLQGERRASNLRRRQIGSWFGEYQNTLASLRNQTQQGYDQALGGFNAQVAQQGSSDAAQRQALYAQSQQDAAKRGAVAGSQPQLDAQNAASQRANLTSTFGGMIGAQGANQRAYLNEKQRIGAGEKVHQLLAESARKRSLDSDMRALAQKIGDFRTTYRATARDAERKYQLALQGLANQLKVANLSAQTSASNAALSASTQIRGQNLTNARGIRGQNISRANSKRGAKGGKGRTGKARDALLALGSYKGPTLKGPRAVSRYLQGLGYSKGIANAVANRHHKGKHHKRFGGPGKFQAP